MHEYYRNIIPKLKKENEGYLHFVKAEMEQKTGKPYRKVWQEIWDFYERNLLEHFPYIGGDKVSGTKNLTGAYSFVAMGEVLKRYGVSLEDSAHLMVLAYERKYQSIPRPVRAVMGKMFSSSRLVAKMYRKKDRKNAENAAKYPGSFETKPCSRPQRAAPLPIIPSSAHCPTLQKIRLRGIYALSLQPGLCDVRRVGCTAVP